jgi:hypothetical protein
VDQCVHLALARADLVVLVQAVLVVRVLVVQVADQVVLVVRVLVVQVAVSVVLVVQVVAAQVVDLVVLAVVVPAAVLAVAVTDNAVRRRRSHVLVVVKTSMKCCHRQPRRIRKVMLQFQRALSLSNVVLRRKSLHQS